MPMSERCSIGSGMSATVSSIKALCRPSSVEQYRTYCQQKSADKSKLSECRDLHTTSVNRITCAVALRHSNYNSYSYQRINVHNFNRSRSGTNPQLSHHDFTAIPTAEKAFHSLLHLKVLLAIAELFQIQREPNVGAGCVGENNLPFLPESCQLDQPMNSITLYHLGICLSK